MAHHHWPGLLILGLHVTGNTTMNIARMNTNNVNIAARLTATRQARHRDRRLPIGSILLNHVAWVGLALLFTAGFAVALSVFAGRSALDPGPARASPLIFAWCLILSTKNHSE